MRAIMGTMGATTGSYNGEAGGAGYGVFGSLVAGEAVGRVDRGFGLPVPMRMRGSL